MNNCKDCEFGHYTLGAHDKTMAPGCSDSFVEDIYIECLHWDRQTDPFFIRAIDPDTKNCPKEKDVKSK